MSREMLEAADRRFYLEMFGFVESYNLGVATALILQAITARCRDRRGRFTAEEAQAVRQKWWSSLWRRSKTTENRERHVPLLALAESGVLPPTLADLRKSDDAKENFLTKRVLRKIVSQTRDGDGAKHSFLPQQG